MTPAAVTARGLSFRYAAAAERALCDVSFSIPQGSLTVLAGTTGSGKSTLLAALAGLIPRHSAGEMSGTVHVDGFDLKSATPAELARRVGLVQQSPADQICTTTLEAEIAFGLANLATPLEHFDRLIDDALRELDLAELRSRSTRTLSGGQQQRLVLAAILAMRPGLLLCDEPLSQLDPASARDLVERLDRLRREGHTVIVAEHRLDDLLPRADSVVLIDGGRTIGPIATDDVVAVRRAFGSANLPLPDGLALAERLELVPSWSLDDLVEQIDAGRAPAAGPAGHMVSAPAEQPSEPGPPVTVMDHVCFSYGRGNDPVCQDVSVTLHQGERVALLGANGSGKSTLLALLAGLIHPEGGHIHHHDSAPNSKPARLASSLVLQDPDLSLFCATVREELQFGLANLDVDDGQAEELVGEIAHEFALSELLASPPLALSKGQRLRTAVAAVASLRPRLLLLDEPTTGQDPQQVQRVMAAVSRRAAEHGVAVVFATHDLRTVARYADRVLVLAGGRVVFDGRPTALFADDDRLAAARLHLPPLLALRRRLGLAGMTLDQIVAEVRG